MAKEIKWTTKSIIDRVNIYKYWLERNQSNSYPEKLEKLFEKSAEIISQFPYIGTRTDYRDIYSKIVRDYKIFYRVNSDEIQILRVWDTRQHPDKTEL
ncbi:MAG: type II toxin-antitoxin system RelE/ParE family toxin [Cyclobacteriaceae bacterium]